MLPDLKSRKTFVSAKMSFYQAEIKLSSTLLYLNLIRVTDIILCTLIQNKIMQVSLYTFGLHDKH